MSDRPRSGGQSRDEEEEADEESIPVSLPAKKSLPPPRIRPLLFLLILVNLAWSLYQLPLNRVIERRLCREHFLVHDPSLIGDDGHVPEQLCKVDAVQQGLGWIQGVMETTWVVGGRRSSEFWSYLLRSLIIQAQLNMTGLDFVMTIPLVSLVERYGRRPILWLNLVPRIVLLAWTFVIGYFEQALPVKAIMISPIFSVLGGDCVFNSIVYSLVAGMTDDYVLRCVMLNLRPPA